MGQLFENLEWAARFELAIFRVATGRLGPLGHAHDLPRNPFRYLAEDEGFEPSCRLRDHLASDERLLSSSGNPPVWQRAPVPTRKPLCMAPNA